MRVGIYLGRHSGGGGGIGVYAKSVIESLLLLLERVDYKQWEVVIYGDNTVLTQDLLDQLELAPVLSAQTGNGLLFGASSYFKLLPNGARARLLVRHLPTAFGRRFGVLADQLLLPLLFLRDGLDLVHALANCALLLCPTNQLVTVHDLYQAWPVDSSDYKENSSPTTNEKKNKCSTSIRQRFVRLFYRLLFSLQFRSVSQVITDLPDIASEIRIRYRYDPSRISTIKLGLDSTFSMFLQNAQNQSLFSEQNKKWLAETGISPGYVLLLASADPRKNLERSLLSWLSLPKENHKAGLLIKISDPRAKEIINALLAGSPASQHVHILDWLPRADMPFLFFNAASTLIPTIAEGFGYPAVEALALKCPVVTGKIGVLGARELQSGRVFLCSPTNQKSIDDALKQSLESKRTENRRPEEISTQRTMLQAVQENFLLYRQVSLRSASRRTSA